MGSRALALAVVLAAAMVVTAAHGATGPAQIRITDVETSYARVPSAHGGIVGTVEVVKQRLYNAALSRSPIGRASLLCTFLDARARTCVGTYVLPKGTLVVTGAISSRLLYEIPIVGGTGLFDNARGTLTVTSTNLRPRRREVLVFRLSG